MKQRYNADERQSRIKESKRRSARNAYLIRRLIGLDSQDAHKRRFPTRAELHEIARSAAEKGDIFTADLVEKVQCLLGSKSVNYCKRLLLQELPRRVIEVGVR